MGRHLSKQALFRTTRERLWRALTTTDDLRGWLGTKTHLDLRPGGRLHIADVGDGDVVAVDPPRQMTLWWNIFGPEQRVLSTITVAQATGGSLLLIREDGFPDDEQGAWNLGAADVGWDIRLDSLVAWLANGKRMSPRPYGRLEASFGLRDPSGRGTGVVIRAVEPGGAAERVRLQPEDDLVAWDGEPVVEPADLWRCVWSCRPGQQVILAVRRGGQRQTITVTLALPNVH